MSGLSISSIDPWQPASDADAVAVAVAGADAADAADADADPVAVSNVADNADTPTGTGGVACTTVVLDVH